MASLTGTEASSVSRVEDSITFGVSEAALPVTSSVGLQDLMATSRTCLPRLSLPFNSNHFSRGIRLIVKSSPAALLARLASTTSGLLRAWNGCGDWLSDLSSSSSAFSRNSLVAAHKKSSSYSGTHRLIIIESRSYNISVSLVSLFYVELYTISSIM
jgi:hypothetical protein